ncbi:DUF397 domain-containing protein [Streptomyces sp. NPDC001812]|uniref:DUF397 domain-containing protein n=1 Tax=unclassified Streptomyces TaxID=2593676 RepID=UPI00365D4FD7
MTDRTTAGIPTMKGWRKSSYSDPNGGSCLEVLNGDRCGVPVRDSKVPDGPTVVFSRTGWASFITALQQ